MSTINNLENRLKSEENFHDQKYLESDPLPSHYKLQPTYLIYQDMKKLISNIADKDVLEYGCGEGWITVDLACSSKSLDTFDISTTAIQHTQGELLKRGLEKCCRVRKMSAEILEYPDNSFDVVFGFAILHHLDLNKAIAELYRVMKPGARAVFAEPLGTNPLLNLYRKATPQYRTIDEAPLNLKKFNELLNRFSSFEHTEYFLLSLLPLGLSNIKAFFTISAKLFNITIKIDKYLLLILPYLRRFAWYSIMIIKK
jgi:ubiquinone/menaquinone biosynthesis C-methylase UbiE